jgi:hypothetical protein
MRSKIRCDEKSWKNLGTKQATATGEGSPIWDGLLGSSSTSYAGVTGTLAHWLRGSLLGWAHKVSDERRAHTAGGAARSDGHHCGIQRVRYAAACGRWGHARVMPVRCHVSYGGSGLPAGCRWSDSLTPECEGRGHRIKKSSRRRAAGFVIRGRLEIMRGVAAPYLCLPSLRYYCVSLFGDYMFVFTR